MCKELYESDDYRTIIVMAKHDIMFPPTLSLCNVLKYYPECHVTECISYS